MEVASPPAAVLDDGPFPGFEPHPRLRGVYKCARQKHHLVPTSSRKKKTKKRPRQEENESDDDEEGKYSSDYSI